MRGHTAGPAVLTHAILRMEVLPLRTTIHSKTHSNKAKTICLKVLVPMLLLMSLAGGGYAEAASGTWKKDGKSWGYEYADGSYAKSTWEKIGGKWYYFNANGHMVTGWKKLGGKWYFFNTSGAMVTGWKKLNEKWYFFKTSGAMATGWKKISSKWYYFETSGAMVTGIKTISGKSQAFLHDGKWMDDNGGDHRHIYKLYDPIDPTCTKNGDWSFECEICGKWHLDIIPKTGHTMLTETTTEIENYEQIPTRSQKICIGYNGYDFFKHGYITGDEVMAKICYDIEHDVSEEEGGCGTYGYSTSHIYLPTGPGSYDIVTYKVCRDCRHKEEVSREHFLFYTDAEDPLGMDRITEGYEDCY